MDNKKIYPLLINITRNKLIKLIKDSKLYNGNKIENIMQNYRQYLEENLINNNLDLNIIYKDSLIFEEFKSKYKGLYINYVDKSENLEKELFLIYKYLTKNNPFHKIYYYVLKIHLMRN